MNKEKFVFETSEIGRFIIKADNYSLLNKKEHVSLSEFKIFICRLFNIEYVEYAFFNYMVFPAIKHDLSRLRVNMILQCDGCFKWIITDVTEVSFTIVSMSAVPKYYILPKSFATHSVLTPYHVK